MARGVRVPIDADASGLKRGVAESEAALGRLNNVGSRAMGRLKTAAVGAGYALGAGLSTAVVIGTNELIAQERVSGRTANVLETMGGRANVTATQVEALAKSLERATGTADDTIQAGANLLLTFGNIRNEVGKGNDIFAQAVAITNDMATAMKAAGNDEVSLEKTSIQVGKALNDPIKGITALSRVGVSFTKQQKEQIKTLAESGNVLGAQKLILGELRKEFEGAAASEGRITEATQKWRRQFEDLSETVASQLIPRLVSVGEFVEENADTFKKVAVVVGGATAAYVAFSAAAKGASAASKVTSVVTGRTPLSAVGGSLAGGVQKVYVVNMGPGGLGGGGVAGAARRGAGGLAVPGIGSAVGAAGGIGIGGALALGGAAIGAGIGLNELDKRFNFLTPSPAESRRAVEATQNAMIRAWRQGGPKLEDAIRKAIGPSALTMSPASIRAIAKSADDAIDGYRKAITAGGPKVRRSTADITTAALRGLEGLSPAGKRLAADSMVQMARSLESNGRAPKGATRELIRVLSQEIGKLPAATRAAAGSAAASFGELLSTLRVVRAEVAATVAAANAAGSAGGRAITAGESREIRRDRIEQARRRPGSGPVALVPGGNPLGPSDLAALTIADLHRDDSLQDKEARADSERGSAVRGITNPDKIALRGERDVARVRRGEVIRDMATVSKAAVRVKGLIRGRKDKRAKAYAALRGVKGSTEKAEQQREKIREAIANHSQVIRDRYDELNALIRQSADLQAEAADLKFDIGAFTDEISSLPDVTPPEPPPTTDPAGSSAEAAAGVSVDAQAQIDQLTGRNRALENERASWGAFTRALRSSGTIDPAGGTTVVQYIEGSVVQEAQLASYITSALDRQGRPSSGAILSPA